MEREKIKSVGEYVKLTKAQYKRLIEVAEEHKKKDDKDSVKHFQDRCDFIFIELEGLKMLQRDLQEKAKELIEKFKEEYGIKDVCPEIKNEKEELIKKFCEDIKELF